MKEIVDHELLKVAISGIVLGALTGVPMSVSAQEYSYQMCFYEGRSTAPVFKGTLSGDDNSATLKIPANAKEGKFEMETCNGVWPDGTKSYITVSSSGSNQIVRSLTYYFGTVAEDITYRNPTKQGKFNLFIHNLN